MLAEPQQTCPHPVCNKDMDEGLKSLPSMEEINRVFKDFKQVLKVARYRTPLQRIHKIATRHCTIAFTQKLESEAERVFNLLPPGIHTVHNVDFLRVLLAAEQNVSLRVPVSLLNSGQKLVLIKNSDGGQVTFKTFTQTERGLQAFKEEVLKVGPFRPFLPKFVHKVASNASTFHAAFEGAAVAWKETVDVPQRLQQYIQPCSKSASLLRVHWKKGRRVPTYYYICQGASKAKTLPTLLTTIKGMDRSFSDTHTQSQACVKKSTSNLIVQRLKEIPELNKPLEVCVKMISATLRPGEALAEMVCDFTSSSQHQWVFLSCKGFTLETKLKLVTHTMEQSQIIDLRFLMYPLVANRFLLRQRLKWSNKLKTIATQQQSEVADIVSTDMECSLMPPEKAKTFLDSLTDSEDEKEPRYRKRRIVKALLSQDVSHYDRLVMGSRVYKEESRNKINFVEKYGGAQGWMKLMMEFFTEFHREEDVNILFTENLSVEESGMIVCSLLRVIRGDYNFYYKEALKRVHHRLSIRKSQYAKFLTQMEGAVMRLTDSEEDTKLILLRFKQLEEYICRPEESKKRASG